jgi:hypothetical protein
MTPLQSAILRAKEELAAFGQGTKAQPAAGTVDWFRLRAAAAGLAYLQRLETLEVSHDPAACERVYREATKVFKATKVPPPDVIVRETLPNG